MIRFLPAVLVFVLWVYCVVDVIGTRDDRVRHLPKIGWLVLVLLFPLVGSIAWLVAGRPQRPAGRTAPTTRPAPPPPPVVMPETDEELRRRIRDRAEQQRAAYEEQRRREQADPDA